MTQHAPAWAAPGGTAYLFHRQMLVVSAALAIDVALLGLFGGTLGWI